MIIRQCVELWLERTPVLDESGFNFPAKYKAAVETIFKQEREIIEVIFRPNHSIFTWGQFHQPFGTKQKYAWGLAQKMPFSFTMRYKNQRKSTGANADFKMMVDDFRLAYLWQIIVSLPSKKYSIHIIG